MALKVKNRAYKYMQLLSNNANYSCHMKAAELFLTNHTGYISHHFMLLELLKNLAGGCTHTHTHTHTHTCKQTHII